MVEHRNLPDVGKQETVGVPARDWEPEQVPAFFILVTPQKALNGDGDPVEGYKASVSVRVDSAFTEWPHPPCEIDGTPKPWTTTIKHVPAVEAFGMTVAEAIQTAIQETQQ